MTAAAPGARITLTVDGRRLAAEAGATLLSVARRAGIEIPTLCDHPDLEPVGACRLCLVEVGHPDWGEWTNLVTACLYPAAEGLVVQTRSEPVRAARRRILALLAARCPGSTVVHDLAARHGAVTDRLALTEDADACIMCGLCVRVCETYATSAIVTYSRGDTKTIGGFAAAAPADCVGCGGCATVCPTGNIAAARTAAGYEIWQRTFATDTAAVDADRCLGCGACEEACPFHVARVALAPGGRRVAVIPAEQCRGCGACLGACPSGAIGQQAASWQKLRERMTAPAAGAAVAAAAPATSAAAPRLAVLACARSDLGRGGLPAATTVLPVPCAGRASVPLLLSGLAAGLDGVLVLGRHATTCRFGGAEDPGRARAEQAARLAALCGLEPERVRFVEPAPGALGPRAAVARFAADLAALPPRGTRAAALPAELASREGLDAALALADALGPGPAGEGGPGAAGVAGVAGESGATGLASWLVRHDLPAAAPGAPVLHLGRLPRLAVAMGDLPRPLSFPDLAHQALAVMARLGLSGAGVGIDLATSPAGWTLEAAAPDAPLAPDAPVRPLDDLLRRAGNELPRPPVAAIVACDGSPAQVAVIEALGYRAVAVGADPLPPTFSLTPEDRARAEARLRAADAQGAAALLCPGPASLARWALLTRQGTWRSTRARPALAVQLAWLAVTGVPLTPAALAAGLAAPLAAGLASGTEPAATGGRP